MRALKVGDGPCKVDMPTVCTVDQGLERALCLTASSKCVRSPSASRREISGSANILLIRMDFWRLHIGWETLSLSFWGCRARAVYLQGSPGVSTTVFAWGMPVNLPLGHDTDTDGPGKPRLSFIEGVRERLKRIGTTQVPSGCLQ